MCQNSFISTCTQNNQKHDTWDIVTNFGRLGPWEVPPKSIRSDAADSCFIQNISANCVQLKQKNGDTCLGGMRPGQPQLER